MHQHHRGPVVRTPSGHRNTLPADWRQERCRIRRSDRVHAAFSPPLLLSFITRDLWWLGRRGLSMGGANVFGSRRRVRTRIDQGQGASGFHNHQPRLIAAMHVTMKVLSGPLSSAFGFCGECRRRHVPTHRGAGGNRGRLQSKWRAREVNMTDTDSPANEYCSGVCKR